MIALKNRTLLFQGDSISDCSRARAVESLAPDDAALLGNGNGFVSRVASVLLGDDAYESLTIYNRAISGNRSLDLYERWEDDALALTPDVINLLIGVNDTWHEHAYVSVEDYAKVLEQMIAQTQERLPKVQWIFCEPFACASDCFSQSMVDEVALRREVVRQLAIKHEAILVPFAKLFDDLLTQGQWSDWLYDGVHPTGQGHEKMAQCWLETVLG